MFQEYGRILETVMSFKYMGRILTVKEDDCPAFTVKLQKACNIWARMLRILGWYGSDIPRLLEFDIECRTVIFFHCEDAPHVFE